MRHFLRRYLGRAKSPLPRGVLASALGRPLVFHCCDVLSLSPLQHGAAASAVDLAVIARSADVDLLTATRTTEDPRALDHPNPTATFLDTGCGTSDGPARNIAAITAMTRKARAATRAFALSAVRPAYTPAASATKIPAAMTTPRTLEAGPRRSR